MMTKKVKLVASLLSLGIAVADVSIASASVNIEDPLFIAQQNDGYTKLFVGGNFKETDKYGYQDRMLRLYGEVGHSFTDRLMLSLKMAFSGNYSEKRKGLQKANFEALYRIVNSTIKLDLIGGASFGGLMKSEAEFSASGIQPTNYSYGMYGAIFGMRFGGKISERLTIATLIEGTYRFSKNNSFEAKVDAGIVNGIADASFKDLFDFYAQTSTSYELNDKLYLNTKISYQYYDGKIIQDVNGSNIGVNTLIKAKKLKGKNLHDSWSEYGFGSSLMYSFNESAQIGPYAEYLLGGHMSRGAVKMKYRGEYGIKFNAKF